MSGFKTAASMTLVALVTAGIMSVLTAPANAAEQATPTAANTFAQSTAEKVYVTLRSAFTAEKKAAKRAAKATAKKAAKKARTTSPAKRRKAIKRAVAKAVAAVPAITSLPRIDTLPGTLSAPILDAESLNADALDDDGLLTFHTGSEQTAACLDLADGSVTLGRCYGIYEQAPQNLTYTYDTLVRSVQWFDAHSGVYGQTAQSVALVSSVIDTEIAGDVTVTVIDTDGDSLVDGGEVTLTVAGTCGVVVLPEHDPTGTTYRARLLHGTC